MRAIQLARSSRLLHLNHAATLSTAHAASTQSHLVAPVSILSASFHTSTTLSAAPTAAKPAAAGKPGAAPAGPSQLNTPPVKDSPRWVKEGWGSPRLVPVVKPGQTSTTAADEQEEKDAKTLPILHAEVREQTGSKYSQKLRKQNLRIPGIICDRAAPRTNQLLITVDRFELEQICRKFRRTMNNRVVLLKLPNQEPIKVIADEIIRHAVTEEILAANWFLFKPNTEKVRVNIPIVYTGTEECIGVKRGGVIVILRDNIPCVWTGDENIPSFMHIDMTNADGGKVYRNADLKMPTGLRIYDPKFDYVLASVIGVKTKGGREDEDVGAAATAATPTAQQPSAIQLEKEKKEKERREEEEMVAQKMAQKGARGKK